MNTARHSRNQQEEKLPTDERRWTQIEDEQKGDERGGVKTQAMDSGLAA
jgi:hypothetical protein